MSKKKRKLINRNIIISFAVGILFMLLIVLAFNLLKSGQAEFNEEEDLSRGLNLIFYADRYESQEAFDNDIIFLMSELKKREPWGSYNNFNIYKINPMNEKEICVVETENLRKPSLRCSEEINNYLQKINVKRFKVIVLSRQEFESWANVARLKNSGVFFSVSKRLNKDNSESYGTLFTHLIGHAFGLKDEEIYVVAKSGGAPHTPDGPNCAPDIETAESWWGDLAKEFIDVGIYKGCCGNKEYIKPASNSVMNLNEIRSSDVDYGPVSERYLRNFLKFCFSGKKYSYNDNMDFFERYPEFKECLND
ncbi:MAG: hypothetical protein KJ685_00980 [Nanoarchaeota archaeon]|nr:hypothetical protein [Nanoarchaeota archaeon]